MKTAKKPKPPLAYPPLPYGTILMALDVSSAVTGWAVGKITEGHTLEVREFGYMKPPGGWPFERRVDEMLAGIDSVIKNYLVTHIAMETQDHRSTNRRVQGLAILGRAQGAIWATLRSRIPVDCVPVRDATKLNGKNCKKSTRCEWVKTQVPEYAARTAANSKYDVGMDASDSIALLIYRAKLG